MPGAGLPCVCHDPLLSCPSVCQRQQLTCLSDQVVLRLEGSALQRGASYIHEDGLKVSGGGAEGQRRWACAWLGLLTLSGSVTFGESDAHRAPVSSLVTGKRQQNLPPGLCGADCASWCPGQLCVVTVALALFPDLAVECAVANEG